MQAAKAIIRKPAPAFAGQAWWNNKFQEINLDQFKGKHLFPHSCGPLSCSVAI